MKNKDNGIELHSEVFPRGEVTDVSNLSYLYYRYPLRENVKIPQPMSLFVGDDGHKVIDAFGAEHFMPIGFFHIKYKIKGEQGEKQILVENSGLTG